MSSPAATPPEPSHDPNKATEWFKQWHVYRAIVDANWMAHGEIFRAIRAWVLLRHPGPFTLLDLGCGDAGFVKHTFDETGLWSYVGVDASAAALDQARRELAGARFQVELVAADMLAFLRQASVPPRTFDVILASYAVHHLPVREKQEFFTLAHGKLATGGSLLFADIFRRDGEAREEYLARYVGMMQTAWHGMSPQDLAGTIEHVTQRDFPETIAALSAMARDAGLSEPQELFRDATGFHRLMAFRQATDVRRVSA